MKEVLNQQVKTKETKQHIWELGKKAFLSLEKPSNNKRTREKKEVQQHKKTQAITQEECKRNKQQHKRIVKKINNNTRGPKEQCKRNQITTKRI
jgi:hypothetical protein